jgi:hypothetical protein
VRSTIPESSGSYDTAKEALTPSSRVSPSLASRATRSASGLLYLRIAALRRSRASVSHLGSLRGFGFLAAPPPWSTHHLPQRWPPLAHPSSPPLPLATRRTIIFQEPNAVQLSSGSLRGTSTVSAYRDASRTG